MQINKFPEQYLFFDISDYARPVAERLARLLLPTAITPIHLTLLFIAVGMASSVLFSVGTYGCQFIAGLLLPLKSMLDAADGSLARVRNHPSRVGRFLDAIGDFVVNVVVLLAIGIAEYNKTGQVSAIWLALIALASVTWQVSIYNYFSVLYRTVTKGDLTSQIVESSDSVYAWDNRTILRLLAGIYHLLYAWQDRLIAHIDRSLLGADPTVLASKRFMILTSVIGLGTHLLILCVFAMLGKPMLALYVIVFPLNLYWIALFYFRSHSHKTVKTIS